MVSLHFLTKPVAADLSKGINEVRVIFKQVKILGFKTEYLSTPLPFWLRCLRRFRFHGELELVVVMMTVAFAGGGHLGEQQCSGRAKREEEGSTKTVYSVWELLIHLAVFFKQMALLMYMNLLTRPVIHH